jgi:formylglycine-generating enzyme required for sulfatase activity
MADFLVSQEWQPFFPMEQYGVYSSQWSLKGKTLWTIVNRNPYDLDGIQIRLPLQEGWHYFDLWNGSELTPETDGREALLTFPIEAHGFAAILARREALDTQLKSLLSDLKRLSARPLSSYSAEWHFLPQKMIPIAKTTPRPGAPVGMVIIPAGDFVFKVSGIEIEGANVAGVDVQYPWEDSPRRHHLHKLHINSFWIDKYPVTNREFQEFLDATHYHPKDNKIFLHDWKDGVYPQGWGNKPVTWVSLEDARAYAAWAGKRLPHEWEWQYAAQGTDGRAYPWGNTWDESAVPTPDINRTMRGPDDVDKHAKGTSPFGVEDMVGNVWQWTDEFVDEHTRAEIVRGGSYYQPQGAVWYFPQTYQLDPYGNSILMHLDQHSKLLLMAPSIDRAGTVGFRCVKDMQ